MQRVNISRRSKVSYDAVNVYPPVRVDKARNVLIYSLNNNKEQLSEYKKLSLRDIHKLTELYLSVNYLFENYPRLFQNSGPIELSHMVVLSESYLQKLEFKVIMKALIYKIAPKSFRHFVDDSHSRFEERSHPDTFSEI